MHELERLLGILYYHILFLLKCTHAQRSAQNSNRDWCNFGKGCGPTAVW